MNETLTLIMSIESVQIINFERDAIATAKVEYDA
jgi:hypothetical protein